MTRVRFLACVLAILALIATLIASGAAASGNQPLPEADGENGRPVVDAAVEAPGLLGDDLGFVEAADFPVWTETTHPFPNTVNPRGIAVHPSTGRILVADRTGDLIDVYDAGGAELGTIGAGTLVEPQGVFITPTGDIYVASEGSDRVSVWGIDGTLKRSWGTLGAGDGQFNEPCDVVVTDLGEVFVADALNNRVQVFDVNGGYLRKFGSAGAGAGQFAMDCSGASLEVAGSEVFVTDTLNARVQVFDLAGNYLRQWGTSGPGNGQFNGPTGIASSMGMIYVVDFGNNRVQVFTDGGVFQGSIEVASLGPRGVFVDPAGDVLYVTEQSGAVRIFTTRTCEGLALDFVGGSYGETFVGTALADIVHTGGGDDSFDALAGDDTVCGGPGNDSLGGSEGRDRIHGEAGNDTIFGGLDVDRLWGDAGSDEIDGGGGSDRIWGGDHADVILGGSGADRIYGGNGPDDITGQGGQDTIDGGNGDDVIQGSHQSDDIYGGADNDTLRGAGGKDEIWGDAGNDSLFGGDNSDTLRGGPGNDSMNGQKGHDTCIDNSGTNTRTSC